MIIHHPARALLVLAALNLQSAICNQLLAMPQTRIEPCPACHGKRSLSLTPPNLGQFNGEIGVTPGKPFKTSRFDVTYDICPLCNGTGRHERWTMARLPPPEGENLVPCVNCLGTGIAPCQKCRKTGYIPCAKCKGAKKTGWILTEEKTAGSTSRHKKKTVIPCDTCKGVGKAECPSCESRGGTVCKKCAGEGYIKKKERK